MTEPEDEAAAHVHQMPVIEAAMAENLRAYVAAFEGTEAVAVDVGPGVAAYTGRGSPLSTVKGLGPMLGVDELDAIEAFGEAHGVSLPIELAPWPTGEADTLLGRRGYRMAEREDVVSVVSPGAPPPAAASTEIVAPDVWMRLQVRLAEEDSGAADPVLERLLGAASRLAGARNLAVAGPADWSAAAQSVRYGEVVVFGNDATSPSARIRGLQTSLIRDRLAAVPAGHLVAAEVAPGSGSERNYLRCGFELAYTRRIFVRE